MYQYHKRTIGCNSVQIHGHGIVTLYNDGYGYMLEDDKNEKRLLRNLNHKNNKNMYSETQCNMGQMKTSEI